MAILVNTVTEIHERMNFISDYFIASNIQTYYLGKNARNELNTGDGDNDVLPILLSYSHFTTMYLSGTITDTEIYYKTRTADVWTKSMPTDVADDVMEFNMSLAIPTNSITAKLLALLDNIRVTYNLLDDVAIKRYMAQDNTLEVNRYALNNSLSTPMTPMTYHKITNITEIRTHVVNIIPDIDKIDSSSSNLLVIRRVLLGYESMIHCYIALYTNNQSISDLTNKKFKKMNSDLLDRATGIGKLQTALTNRVNMYNAQIKTIGTIDKDLVKFRENVEAESDDAISNEGYLKKNTIMFLIIMLIFIVCAVSLTGVLIVQQDKNASPTTMAKQKILVGIVFVVSAISMIVVYFVNQMTNVEKFALAEDAPRVSEITYTFNTYLEYTINIALLVDNYKRYGDITNAAKKEAYFYDGVNSQLKLRKETLTDKQTQEYRSAKIAQYRVYMLLQILLAVSIFVFIGLYTGPNSIVLTFMIITVLIIVYMYLITTNNMVFTDATKLYWGHPTPEMLN